MTREEALDVLKRNYPSRCFEDLCKAVDMAIEALSAQPEPPVKHGKWIRKSPTAWMWTCSCCKKDDVYAYSAGESFEPDVLQDLFCPNCGAKMDGGEG